MSDDASKVRTVHANVCRFLSARCGEPAAAFVQENRFGFLLVAATPLPSARGAS